MFVPGRPWPQARQQRSPVSYHDGFRPRWPVAGLSIHPAKIRPDSGLTPGADRLAEHLLAGQTSRVRASLPLQPRHAGRGRGNRRPFSPTLALTICFLSTGAWTLCLRLREFTGYATPSPSACNTMTPSKALYRGLSSQAFVYARSSH